MESPDLNGVRKIGYTHYIYLPSGVIDCHHWDKFCEYTEAFITVWGKETKTRYKLEYNDAFFRFNGIGGEGWEDLYLEGVNSPTEEGHNTTFVFVKTNHVSYNMGCVIILVIASMFFDAVVISDGGSEVFESAGKWLLAHESIIRVVMEERIDMATAPFENNPFLHTDIPRALLCPYCGFFCNDSERVVHHIEQKHIKPYRDFFSPACKV